jgi:hypothetical protein
MENNKTFINEEGNEKQLTINYVELSCLLDPCAVVEKK